MAKSKNDVLFEYQFKLAWEHFKFHAEQRTRMFNFFLLTIGFLINAFSLMILSGQTAYQDWAFLILCFGGILSTMFLTLDVRNTQLLEHSEALLRKIEEETLYKGTVWYEERVGGEIKLGLLSREAVLKEYIAKPANKIPSEGFCRWICVENIKHKLAIRFILILSIVAFWITSILVTPSTFKITFLNLDCEIGSLIRIIEIVFFVISLCWVYWALLTPGRDIRWEQAALK